MDPAQTIYITSLTIGLMLLAVEIFVPGGVLGTLGAVSLLVAVVTGFFAFGPQGGLMAALLLVVFGGIFFGVWIKLFPRTHMGKLLTLQTDGRQFKSAGTAADIHPGVEGTAATHLHPSGLALLAGQRVDVISESGFIAEGSRIKVVLVEGNRVVVRALPA